MSTTGRSRPAVAVTLAGLVVVVSAAAAMVAARASSVPSLPAIASDRLVASLIRVSANPPAVSGMVATHVDLGIPSLPDVGAQVPGPARLVSALTGDHRVRLWESTDGVRLAELLPAAEFGLFVGRTDAWFWDSRSYTAYHFGPYALPTSDTGSGGASGNLDAEGPASLLDPLALAQRSLAALSSSTIVTVGTNRRVAGHPAYVLNLEPRTPATLVGRVSISIDAERRIPLGVAVYARGAGSPALSAEFTSISFAPIDPATYGFTPPLGASVRRQPSGVPPSSASGARSAVPYGNWGSVRVFGHEWATIVAVRIPSLEAPTHSRGRVAESLLKLLPYSGPLFSIRLVPRVGHAWLAYGAVPQSSLAAVSSKLP